ncbi:hypothetical protein [Sphingomonas sp.]|uniref:hypothetical protein n=1 Tax=Sphingomonas sp. TaxID=28214 RepID=UPI0035C7BD6B
MNRAATVPAPSGPMMPFPRMGALGLLIVLVLFVLTPSALRYSYNLSSFAPGVAVVAVAVWGLATIGIVPGPPRAGWANHFLVVAVSCGLIGAHIALTYLRGEPELGRPLTSLALLGVILTTTRHVGFAFFASVPHQRIALHVLLGLFLVIAVMGLLGIAPRSELISERPLYPFTEPSHFAFTLMPFLIYGAVTAGPVLRLIILAVAAIMVILLKSLSLAVGLILAGACCLNGIALAIFLLSAFAGLSMLDLTYFTDRLDFAYGNQNLSMLVYRQGLELIQTSLEETGGWGIGFQRLGFTNLFTPSSNIIYALTGADLNLRDGGFNAAKLITELGVAGIILSLWYLVTLTRMVIRLRGVATGRLLLSDGTCFALAAFVGAAIEVFVRGAGYFTSTMLLGLAAIPYLRLSGRKALIHVAH